MAEVAKVRIDIGSKADLKGFKQVETASQKLGKSVKKLGVAFGAAFTVAGAKNAVRAFAADDKAAKALSRTLNNLGLAFADPAVKTFIADLERQFGVLDDQLRPAFQKLLTTTGDVTRSQDLLKTALDLSAMSGVDVVTVSGDLARAFTGNTRVLGKYSLGINKADLAIMSFDEILTRVAKVSSGQAQAAADTLAGSIAKLQVATANASESIGKDLVTALTTLGGQGGLPKTLSLIESLASTIGDAIIGFSRLIQLVVIFGSGNPLESLKDAAAFNKANAAADLAERGAGNTNFRSKNAKDAASVIAAKNATALAKSQTTLTKVTKDQLKLAKAKAIFDMQRIQIEAALKGKISEEDRIRLRLLKAIIEENTTDIDKYTKLLDEAQKKTLALQEALKNAGSQKISNVFTSEFYKGMSEADASLERIKESGAFRLAGIGNLIKQDFYAGLDAAQTALERFKEAGNFRLAGVGGFSAMPAQGAGAFNDTQNAARLLADEIARMQAMIAAMSNQGTTGNTTIAPMPSAAVVTNTGTAVTVIVQGTVVAQADLEKSIQDAINASNASGNSGLLTPKTWRGEV